MLLGRHGARVFLTRSRTFRTTMSTLLQKYTYQIRIYSDIQRRILDYQMSVQWVKNVRNMNKELLSSIQGTMEYVCVKNSYKPRQISSILITFFQLRCHRTAVSEKRVTSRRFVLSLSRFTVNKILVS